MGNRLTHLSRKFYSNVLIVSKDGIPLSTVSDHKADWYLKRTLAQEISAPHPFPRAIQLNFVHQAEADPKAWDLHIGEDQCVMCGSPSKLSLHHIVPYVIRKHFPVEHKKHSREWCVLLCIECHTKVENYIQPIYKTEFPYGGKRPRNTNLTLRLVKKTGQIESIPPERLQLMLSRSDYKSVAEIPEYTSTGRNEHFANVSRLHQEALKTWALKFIDDHGGIDGTNQYFLELFMKSKPAYLPSWFSALFRK